MLRRAIVSAARSSATRAPIPSSSLFKSRIAVQARTQQPQLLPSIARGAVQSGVRWYSVEAEKEAKSEEGKKAEDGNEVGKEEGEKKEDGELVELRKKLEEKEREAVTLKV